MQARLIHERTVIFVAATTGQGDEPDNMKVRIAFPFKLNQNKNLGSGVLEVFAAKKSAEKFSVWGQFCCFGFRRLIISEVFYEKCSFSRILQYFSDLILLRKDCLADFCNLAGIHYRILA